MTTATKGTCSLAFSRSAASCAVDGVLLLIQVDLVASLVTWLSVGVAGPGCMLIFIPAASLVVSDVVLIVLLAIPVLGGVGFIVLVDVEPGGVVAPVGAVPVGVGVPRVLLITGLLIETRRCLCRCGVPSEVPASSGR